MARNPSAIKDDVDLAGQFVAEGLDAMRRRGWLPFVLLAAAASIGLALSRRPADEVARGGAGLVERGLQVAAALAAVERFRGQRGHRHGARAA